MTGIQDRHDQADSGPVVRMPRPPRGGADDAAAVDASGSFEVTGTLGEHELVVQGLPQGWGIRGTRPLIWLDAAEAIAGVRVEIGPRLQSRALQ